MGRRKFKYPACINAWPLGAIGADFIMTQPDKLYGLEIPYNKTVDELVQLSKEKPPVCWTAYTALSYDKTAKSIQALDDLLANKDWTHVRSAIEAIGRNINGKELEDKLIGFLASSNKFIVTAAIKSLSELKSVKAHDKIKALFNSENIEIKKAAFEGISNIWEAADFDFLIQVYKTSTNERLRKTIGFVLAEHVNEANWKKLFDLFHNDNITRHRDWSLVLANQFSKDQILVDMFLNDKDGHIRRKAKQFRDPTKSA